MPKDGWDWPAFLSHSRTLLCYAFEKEDAKAKYGDENILAALTNGRSLRFTAEIIYECGICGPRLSFTPCLHAYTSAPFMNLLGSVGWKFPSRVTY